MLGQLPFGSCRRTSWLRFLLCRCRCLRRQPWWCWWLVGMCSYRIHPSVTVVIISQWCLASYMECAVPRLGDVSGTSLASQVIAGQINNNKQQSSGRLRIQWQENRQYAPSRQSCEAPSCGSHGCRKRSRGKALPGGQGTGVLAGTHLAAKGSKPPFPLAP